MTSASSTVNSPIVKKPMQVSGLHGIQEDSEKQELPKQEHIFAVAKRVRSRLTHLPDPTHPPLGFVPGRGFDVAFPFTRLPELRPILNGDWVQFGSPELGQNLLYYGDNLQVLRTLSSECIDLIYIDPPFFSGEVYNVIWGDGTTVGLFIRNSSALSGNCPVLGSGVNVTENHATQCSGFDCTGKCPGPMCDRTDDPGYSLAPAGEEPLLCLRPGTTPLINGGTDIGYDMWDGDPANYNGVAPEVGARESGVSRDYAGLISACP